MGKDNATHRRQRASDAEARALYESGLSGDAVAARMGLTKTGVLAKVRRAGGTVRPTGRNTNARGWHLNSDGYRYVVVRPDWEFFTDMATPYGSKRKDGTRSTYRVAEHRKMMADALGRALLPTETVHHINGNRADNRLENLQLRQGRHGKGQALRCRCCGSSDIEAVAL